MNPTDRLPPLQEQFEGFRRDWKPPAQVGDPMTADPATRPVSSSKGQGQPNPTPLPHHIPHSQPPGGQGPHPPGEGGFARPRGPDPALPHTRPAANPPPGSRERG